MVSMIISSLVILVVPKLIGVVEYGYWQLYLFYSTYVGLLHFGWNDGIYLRYGGKKYNELDEKLFFSQFFMLVILQLVLLVLIFCVSNVFIINDNRSFILKMIAFCMIIMNVRYMLLYILQGTNRVKEYAQITLLDRVLYCCLIVVSLMFGINEYRLLIIADLIGKFISLLYAMYCCRNIVFCRISTFYFSFKEALENISVGIKLMFANLSNKLILGVVRFGIERTWGVVVFGKVSLTLSISNFLMGFIDAVGLVMFPVLRRTDEKKLSSIYITIRDFLMIIMLGGALLFFYPIKIILSTWLPHYTDSFFYMTILFPMVVYEGKMGLLINTYLNTLRKEKLMLNINIVSLFLSIVLTTISTIIFKNLILTILSILIVLVFRSFLGELCLSKILGISLLKDTIFELVITAIFIISWWYIDSWIAVVVCGIVYITYIYLKRKDIYKAIQNIKVIVSP